MLMRFLLKNVMIRVESKGNFQVLLLYKYPISMILCLMSWSSSLWTCKMVLYVCFVADHIVMLWGIFGWWKQKRWIDLIIEKLNPSYIFAQILPFLSCTMRKEKKMWVVIVGCTRMISCDTTRRPCLPLP